MLFVSRWLLLVQLVLLGAVLVVVERYHKKGQEYRRSRMVGEEEKQRALSAVEEGIELAACVYRLVGLRRAVCWVEGGSVIEVEVTTNGSDGAGTARGGTFMAAALGAHVWRPRRVLLLPPIEWNASRGVLEVGGVCPPRAARPKP
jgi:hypothetical protein